MGSILVRNLDDDVISELEVKAKENHRSLEAEIRFLLTEIANRRSQLTSFREFSKRVMASTADTQRTDSVDLIREDRDR
ncbi:MAG: hypothetical protein OXG15_12150 [Gammaproteobacteria bacterium]|nr:hypothetical protein [Gammaproteobacteria bacterium]